MQILGLAETEAKAKIIAFDHDNPFAIAQLP
jgi:hypothetical protein